MKSRRLVMGLISLCAVAFSACSSSSVTPVAPKYEMSALPASISPAQIAYPPMAKTAILPPSAMQSPRNPSAVVSGASWTAIPGSASQAAAAPDGSLWVLSTGPAGPDKYIWHYVSGSWTNVGGLATRLAVAPNGTLYAINSGGGTFSYSGGVWSGLGGGAQDITIGADSSVYVLSNGGAGADHAIWKNTAGTWSQLPGSGVRIAANWDPSNKYGSFQPGGIYILNSAGGIYYENPDSSFIHLPGSASDIVGGRIGGFYVLGYPANSGGNSIYYYDLENSNGVWAPQAGGGVGISANLTTLYALGASGGIYSSPITAARSGVTFLGYTQTHTLTPGGGTWSLPAYKGVAASILFGASDASGMFPLTLTDATNTGGDITGPFTPYTTSPSTPGTAFVYFEVYNPGPRLTFNQVFGVTITNTNPYPGTQCNIAAWSSNGGGTPSWQTGFIPDVAPSGNTLSIPQQSLPPGNNVQIDPGEHWIGIYCH